MIEQKGNVCIIGNEDVKHIYGCLKHLYHMIDVVCNETDNRTEKDEKYLKEIKNMIVDIKEKVNFEERDNK